MIVDGAFASGSIILAGGGFVFDDVVLVVVEDVVVVDTVGFCVVLLLLVNGIVVELPAFEVEVLVGSVADPVFVVETLDDSLLSSISLLSSSFVFVIGLVLLLLKSPAAGIAFKLLLSSLCNIT